MTDSIDTSEREAEEPRMLRLPALEMSAEPAPPPVAAGFEVHPVGTLERLASQDAELRRLSAVEARQSELIQQAKEALESAKFVIDIGMGMGLHPTPADADGPAVLIRDAIAALSAINEWEKSK